MNNVTKQLQSLYEQELYSNVVRVCNLALSVLENKNENISALDKLQFTVIYADSLYHTQNFSHAEQIYRQALQTRKFVLKNKIIENQSDFKTDIEIKYKIYQCCIELKQINAAMTVLQSISPRNRTPKINMALANLFRDTGMERSAVTCYKEVLRESPLALDAIENLLKIGIKGTEVNSLVVEVISEVPWLNLWLKAQSQLHSREFSSALQTFKSLDTHPMLKDNPNLLVNMAYCLHYMCDDERAISTLQRALKLDQNLLFGRDLLSTLLVASSNSECDDQVVYLESICPSGDTSLWSSEHWIVLGNYMLATKKFEKAAYFSQQALIQSQNNIEAILLRAKTHYELNKLLDAAQYCKEALQLCPFRYDLYACLVECYIKVNRLRDADTMAQKACKELNHSSEALTLHASVLLIDSMTSTKTVRKMLEKAVAQNKTRSTKAVCMLVVLFNQEQQYEQARQVLLKSVELNPSSHLHQLLGDCYVNLEKDEDALNHYNIALKLDPSNKKAVEGLEALGHSAVSKRESYHTCVGESSYTSQGTTVSDVDVCGESDTDPWPTNNSFQ